jgi:hypothetical protein
LAQRFFIRRLCPLLLLFVLARAQSSPTRIQLKPGGPVVTVEGEVEKDKDVVFVFQAQAGSKFKGHLTTKSGKAGFEVNDPDGQGLPEEEFDFNTNLTGSLKKTGDYKIAVATFEARRIHFTLAVQVD